MTSKLLSALLLAGLAIFGSSTPFCEGKALGGDSIRAGSAHYTGAYTATDRRPGFMGCASGYHHGRRHASSIRRPVILKLNPATYQYEIPHPASGSYPVSVSIHVSGSHFRRGAVVRWNGKPVRTRFVSSTHLEAVVPFTSVRAVPLSGTGPDFTATAHVTAANPRHGGISKAVSFPMQVSAVE